MKRSKPRSSGKGQDAEGDKDFFAKPKEAEKNWEAEVASKPDEAFSPYALTTRFDKGQLVTHPKFGKGLVTFVEGTRIEILFQEGTKKLGHAAT
ncbi:hypothetical protein LVJ94_12930 [Pendulispora rubella]|uniref:Uncharacterized protein n=1 Tax=Pendulispora rubella TaxID=2741070 RepID=A0ABZ2LB55_9BACT